MIANPFICTSGPKLGEIRWLTHDQTCGGSSEFERGDHDGFNRWKEYADFEREKLKELGFPGIHVYGSADEEIAAYTIDSRKHRLLHSNRLIGYTSEDYAEDSESSRLLKRAEFLKAVCEKEGVEFLPKGEISDPNWRMGNLYGTPIEEVKKDEHVASFSMSSADGGNWWQDAPCNNCGQKGLHVCKVTAPRRLTLCETEGHAPVPGDPEGQCVRCPEKVSPLPSNLEEMFSSDDPTETCVTCGKVLKPEGGCYTKAEIDERMRKLNDLAYILHRSGKLPRKAKELIEEWTTSFRRYYP